MRTFRLLSLCGLIGLITLVSCDKDFNDLGSDILGGENYAMGKRIDFTVDAESIATGPVQSNNLTMAPLGLYDDPIYGRTTANFVTQLELGTVAPTIGENIAIRNVILEIPYFSTLEDTDETGASTYSLDSLYTSGNGHFKLEVFRSGYFLRNQEMNGSELVDQYYYTDENAAIDAAKIGTFLNDSAVVQHEDFFFDPAEHADEETDDDGTVTTTRTAPSLRIGLNSEYFKTVILETAAQNLASQNAFKEYFRGLYFQCTDNGTGKALNMLNFSQGTVTISYLADGTTDTDGNVTRVEKTLVLNMTGNNVSLQTRENENLGGIGSDRLLVKGGPGYVTKIDLFNGDSDGNGVNDLEDLRSQDWMINEASLTFYVDQDAMATYDHEPRRVYLYDMTNKQSIIDYQADNTTYSADVKLNKYVFGGILERDSETEKGIRYKVRITNFVRSLIEADSTNVSLGLAVTESISNATMVRRRSGYPDFDEGSDFVPLASVIHPLGTVLYGPNYAVDDKRLKLTVYYSKRN